MALMGSSPEQALTDRQRAALETLLRDLRTIFGARLHALVAYGVVSTNVHESYVRTLGLVERVAFDDLARAVPLAAEWLRRGLAVPLLLSRHEFERTLDVFPLEYGGIIASHQVVVGEDVLAGLRVSDADLRRGIELQAKSHLIHLREGYIESGGHPKAVGQLIAASAPARSTSSTARSRLSRARPTRSFSTGAA